MTLFPILLEIEEPLLGKVLLSLKSMPGVAKMHLDLDGAGKKKPSRVGLPSDPRPKKLPRGGRPISRDVILAELMSGPKTSDDLRAVLVKHGFMESSMHPMVGDLKTKGIVESTAAGVYRLTQAALEKIGKSAPTQLPAPQTNGVTPGKRMSTGSGPVVIAKIITEAGGIATRRHLIEAGAKLGLTERIVSGNLSRMKNRKLLLLPEPAHYKLTAKAIRLFASPPEGATHEPHQANQEG
jgi:hypothetical protein